MLPIIGLAMGMPDGMPCIDRWPLGRGALGGIRDARALREPTKVVKTAMRIIMLTGWGRGCARGIAGLCRLHLESWDLLTNLGLAPSVSPPCRLVKAVIEIVCDIGVRLQPRLAMGAVDGKLVDGLALVLSREKIKCATIRGCNGNAREVTKSTDVQIKRKKSRLKAVRPHHADGVKINGAASHSSLCYHLLLLLFGLAYKCVSENKKMRRKRGGRERTLQRRRVALDKPRDTKHDFPDVLVVAIEVLFPDTVGSRGSVLILTPASPPVPATPAPALVVVRSSRALAAPDRTCCMSGTCFTVISSSLLAVKKAVQW